MSCHSEGVIAFQMTLPLMVSVQLPLRLDRHWLSLTVKYDFDTALNNIRPLIAPRKLKIQNHCDVVTYVHYLSKGLTQFTSSERVL